MTLLYRRLGTLLLVLFALTATGQAAWAAPRHPHPHGHRHHPAHHHHGHHHHGHARAPLQGRH